MIVELLLLDRDLMPTASTTGLNRRLSAVSAQLGPGRAAENIKTGPDA
jgi:hypothetical protein